MILVRNFTLQLGNYALSGVLFVWLWIIIARQSTIADFSSFSVVYTWASIYGLVIDLGLDFWSTRQTAIKPKLGFPINLVVFRVFTILFLGLVFFFIGVAFNQPPVLLALFIGGAGCLNLSHYISCFLRGSELLSLEALLSIVKNLSFAYFAIDGLYKGYGIVWVGWSYLFTNLTYLFLTILFCKKHGFVLASAFISISTVLKNSWLVWITILLLGLSIKLDITLLEWLNEDNAVANYSAAARIFEGCLLLATAFSITLFPRLSRYFESEPYDYRGHVWRYARLLFGLSVFASLIGGGIGHFCFSWFFGEHYQNGRQLFVYMMSVFPIGALVIFLYNALIAAKRGGEVFLWLSSALMLNILIDYLLIPRYGEYGAFYGYLGKDTYLLIGFSWTLWKLGNMTNKV